MNEKDELVEFILKLNDNFRITNVEDYQTFIQLLYNNLTVLEEENKAVNEALMILLQNIYKKLDPNSDEFFSPKERLFSHFLQNWMEDY